MEKQHTISAEPDWAAMRGWVEHVARTDPAAARRIAAAMGGEAPDLDAALAEVRCEACGGTRFQQTDYLPEGFPATLTRGPDGRLIVEVEEEGGEIYWDGRYSGRIECAECCHPVSGLADYSPTNPTEDAGELDNLAAFVNRPGEVNGGDLVEFVCELLVRSGREVLDNAEEVEE